MPDLPTIAGGPTQVASTAASSTGITVTASGSTNTKGSYTELISSLSYAASWLYLTISKASGGTAYLIDIAIGASTSEVVVINNIYYQQANNINTYRTILVPLSIPAGTRIAARCQCVTSSGTVVLTAHAIASPISAPPSLRSVETVGADTTGSRGTVLGDPGGVAHTDGAWTQITASTAQAWRWLIVDVGNTTDLNWAATQEGLFDIGVGGAGSEVQLIGDLWTGVGSAVSDGPPVLGHQFPVAIPAGTRVVARHRQSGTTAGDRRLELVLHGVG